MHVIDENGPSTLCDPSARSVTPSHSPERKTPGGGCAEIRGREENMDEDLGGCRVDENVRVAVEAGDIPSATDMDPTLGKLGELGSLADRSRNWAGTLGRAHGAVRGPVRHTYSQPFSPTSASDQGANQESQDGDCSGQMGLEKMEMEPTGSESASTATSTTRCERCGNAHKTISQVVVGGRTYMQGMLSQFKGLLVDWQRGQVKPSGGEWRNRMRRLLGQDSP